MARLTQRLSALKVQQLTDRGWYPDGLGLYLQVSASGTKSWVYRYTRNGKQHWHGLGSVTRLHNLKSARLEAEHCRELIRQNLDPIALKQEQARAQRLEQAVRLTFSECAYTYIEQHKHGWKNQKHLTQWRNTLKTYAAPVIGDLPVQAIELQHVLSIIEPMWHVKTETANRVRQRIEIVLDWATAMGYREGLNPARWRGHIEKLLPRPKKVTPVQHHRAVPYLELPGLFALLQEIDSTASRALQFMILTATRSGEARNASWSELDLSHRVWELPAARMKSGQPHRVPLSHAASTVLPQPTDSEFVFQSQRTHNSITEAATRKLLKSLAPEATAHGFRSSFRDWCAETTRFPRELAEKALSHSVGSQTEAAYQRGDMFERRRELMDAWAAYCLGQDAGERSLRVIGK